MWTRATQVLGCPFRRLSTRRVGPKKACRARGKVRVFVHRDARRCVAHALSRGCRACPRSGGARLAALAAPSGDEPNRPDHTHAPPCIQDHTARRAKRPPSCSEGANPFHSTPVGGRLGCVPMMLARTNTSTSSTSSSAAQAASFSGSPRLLLAPAAGNTSAAGMAATWGVWSGARPLGGGGIARRAALRAGVPCSPLHLFICATPIFHSAACDRLMKCPSFI